MSNLDVTQIDHENGRYAYPGSGQFEKATHKPTYIHDGQLVDAEGLPVDPSARIALLNQQIADLQRQAQQIQQMPILGIPLLPVPSPVTQPTPVPTNDEVESLVIPQLSGDERAKALEGKTRTELFDIARQQGLSFPGNISTENLLKLMLS